MEEKNRKPMRFANYDYDQNGSYFITICTKNKKRILSEIVGDAALCVPKITLSEYGKTMEDEIIKMNGIYNDIQTTHFVIMPNHVHMIVEISSQTNIKKPSANLPPNKALSKYIRTLKVFCSRKIGENIWQRSFYDHIIRDDPDLMNHIQYINENPKKWLMGKDEYYG